MDGRVFSHFCYVITQDGLAVFCSVSFYQFLMDMHCP